MRVSLRLKVFVMLLLTTIALVGCHPKQKHRKVVLESANDKVFVLKPEGKIQVPSGQTSDMTMGDGVDVDHTGMAFLHFPDYMLVRIFRDTGLKVEEMTEPNAPPAAKLRMDGGTVFVDVDSSVKFVSIENDVAVVTAMGTSFWVHVRPEDHATWVLVKQGKVVLGRGRSAVIVKPGFQSWVAPGENPHEPVPNLREYVPPDILPPMDELTGNRAADADVFRVVMGGGRAPTPTPTPTTTPVPTLMPTPTLTFELPKPDLTVTGVTVVDGDRIRCFYKNAGDANVPGVSVRLDIFVDGKMVVHSTVHTPIGTGHTGWIQSLPLKLPDEVDVRCMVDPDDSVAESDEGNNSLTRHLTVRRCLPADDLFAIPQKEMELGCAKAPSTKMWTAWQPFEKGYMLWRKDTWKIYVLVSKAISTSIIPPGKWRAYDDKWHEGMPEISCRNAENQKYPIMRGFGYLWCKDGVVRNALGNSRESEKGAWRLTQTFERGWAMQIDELDTVVLTKEGKWRIFHKPS